MELVAPDPAGWAARFATEAARIRGILGPGTPVEHVGSTALGIEAKDVVDVLVGVPAAANPQAVAVLTEAGLVEGGNRTTAEGEPHGWLARWVDGTRVTVVHVVLADGAEWHRRTTFRDALLRDGALAREYVTLKRGIAAQTDDWGEYTARKSSFVARVVGTVGPRR
ncbi:GrpB family protein [Blastococcus sp. TF02A-26]|uniref:GrpB family protein n=1 Tax=Blastococcus sp. TF02A-26 TaxID=2250577 RepID=UPI0013147DEA|nr:GrpB family protein [Blastococcus sp. TF02A-26]